MAAVGRKRGAGREKREVQNSYNQVLKEIERSMGKGITWNSELEKKGKELFGNSFKGVFSKDTIPFISSGNCCIFNLDTRNQPGSHWCALYKLGVNNYVYDSFGRNVMKGFGNVVNSELDAEQQVKENNCGQRSLAWLVCVYSLGLEKALTI